MLGTIAKGFAKLMGTKSDKDIKLVMPMVQQINDEFAKLKDISDDELREKTTELKEYIKSDLKTIDEQINEYQGKVDDNPDMDVSEKEELFTKIDKLEEERDTALEETLLAILPRAFAVVKETARRLTENEKLEVTATLRDKEIAAHHSHVEITGDRAIWKNVWTAAGTEIEWKMIHYDVQLIGGIVLHQGKIAEMATGEGKTLVATLPAYLNALAERGVHIVTVNDYLAKRDAEWNAPIFEFHGLKVDCIDKYQPHSPERRAAYNADITYGTNNEFGFDYLRDNMSRNP